MVHFTPFQQNPLEQKINVKHVLSQLLAMLFLEFGNTFVAGEQHSKKTTKVSAPIVQDTCNLTITSCFREMEIKYVMLNEYEPYYYRPHTKVGGR